MPKPLPEPRRLFIRVKQAADILDISERTLHEWIRMGKGPPVQRFGKGRSRMIRIMYPNFLKWMENPGKHKGMRSKPFFKDEDPVNA